MRHTNHWQRHDRNQGFQEQTFHWYVSFAV
jgi:hypothetical protein